MNVRQHLKIDRLSLTIAVEDHKKARVYENLERLAENGEVEKDNGYGDLLTHYRAAYRIYLTEEVSCIIQIRPRISSYRYMRIDWNPSKAVAACGSSCSRIRSVLAQCIPEFSPEYISQANITRIDLAVDLRRIRVDTISVCGKLRKSTSGRYIQNHTEFSARGEVNSIHIGKYEGDQYLLIYDKAKEAMLRRRRIGIDVPKSRKRFLLALTRVELRLKDQGTIFEFLNRDNPWKRYIFRTFSSIKNQIFDHAWLHFIDSCRFRGTQAALSLIEDKKQRLLYRDRICSATPPSWWDEDSVWQERIGALNSALGLLE